MWWRWSGGGIGWGGEGWDQVGGHATAAVALRCIASHGRTVRCLGVTNQEDNETRSRSPLTTCHLALTTYHLLMITYH